jgi:hypothetical protein
MSFRLRRSRWFAIRRTPARLLFGLAKGTRSRARLPRELRHSGVLLDDAAFERVNGFPNAYWGWGPEDLELGMRCDLAGVGFERRDRGYIALHHKHAGFAAPGVYTEEARRTHAILAQRRDNLAAVAADGLSAIEFQAARAAAPDD